MSAQPKEENNHYTSSDQLNVMDKKVNLNDLMARMNQTKKQEKKTNILLSAAAISAVTVFGIILTL